MSFIRADSGDTAALRKNCLIFNENSAACALGVRRSSSPTCFPVDRKFNCMCPECHRECAEVRLQELPRASRPTGSVAGCPERGYDDDIIARQLDSVGLP